jgi:hypothetical protein
MGSLILGWIAVLLVTALASFWAFWGANEAFHEGWYAATLAARVWWLLPYLAPALVLTVAGLVAIRWPLAGAVLFIALGGAFLVFVWLRGANLNPLVIAMFTLVPIVIGGLYFAGRPQPHAIAYALTGGLPLVVMLAFGAPSAVRVAARVDDGDRSARVVPGNGVMLVWSPAGPGWERSVNVSWQEATDRCRRLTADGLSLAAAPVDIWRLPTIDELVRSMSYHGRNSGGTWDAARQQASYAVRPDKESPLWDTRSPVIYWWTATPAPDDRAWTASYRGATLARPKSLKAGTLGFRAVRARSAPDE